MKMRKLFSVFAALTLAITAIILPGAPVAAAGTITSISPDNGPVGTQVNVSGTGFTAGESCLIYYGANPFGPFTAVGGTVAGSVTVPKEPRGSSFQIHITGTTTGDSAPVSFKVTPQAFIGTTTAFVGDSVTIYGNGFLSSTSIAIYFDSAIIGTVSSDTSGQFDGASFTVPDAYHGVHSVRCKDSSEYSPAINISINAKATAVPSSGGAGDKIKLNGSGFSANSAVSFYWDDNVVVGLSSNTDLNGNFALQEFPVPSGSRGNHVIKIQDVNSNTSNTTFITAQKIVVSPASGVSGTAINVKGSGFDAGKNVALKYGPNTVSPTTGAITSDGSGGFTATFPVPSGSTGDYTIEAYDGTNVAQATFSQLAEIKIDTAATQAKPGYVGQVVTLTGDGLRPNVTVNIYFAPDNTLIGTPTTDGNGHFSASIKIPPSVPGDHSITVTDNLTIKNFPFYIENQVPAAPKLAQPLDNTKLDDPGSFSWDAVTDPSGVTYTLQITTDKNFGALILEKKGLTQASYILSAQEKLSSNNSNSPYYWRVRATDGTALDSAWSDTRTFNVGFVLQLSAWMYGILIGLGGILLFLMGFLLGRRVALR